ncbi:YidH family protein [Nocardioides panaciterrulae]|uniref:Putative membrane protein n=1 Tax=Nocardioides panaciterrulae TaxID=661492 RepID=A0A7Y9JD21_9ACTN|nr:putative membrane protein [Nocardioides panaciterrulae]
MTERRRPHWVYDAGEEPDPRFSLANERTFLAWVRTALAVIAGAVALHQLGLPTSTALRTTVVVGLMLFGGLMAGLAYLHWARVERAMRHRAPLPAFAAGMWLTVAIVLVSVLLALVLAVSGR